MQVNVYCRHISFFVQCIINNYKVRFYDVQNNQGLGKSHQPKPEASRFVWIAVGEEAKQRPGLQVNFYCRDISFFLQCIIKQLLDSVFVISRIIKVEVIVISRSRRLRLITLTSTLIILDITKTSSNNCL